MNIYVISQDVNRNYDTYDSAVVAAPDEDAARRLHPSAYANEKEWWNDNWDLDSWTKPEHVKVELVGTAKPGTAIGIIVSSFNAG